jgi:type I restriction enzyme, R subunit
MTLLRNPECQDLLLTYQRAKRTFWVGYDVKDQVSSRKLFGEWEKPEDYLEAFGKFVRDNVNQIEAIRILMTRPQNWNPDALSKLRGALREHGFGEDRLTKAHKTVYKALADVISMVKHAADQQESLLTAEQRVTKALEELEAFYSFKPDQQKWLTFVAEHLKTNLSISEEDLESQPVFTDRGGLARARKLFGNDLRGVIDRLNYTLVAA